MISVLPQLPCENRYTADWMAVWFRELRKLKVPFIMLGEDKVVSVTKYFTDPLKALNYEANQLRLLCVNPLMNIFCLDVEFPGLLTPAIQVLRLVNPDLKAYGYLHAGSWCAGDVWSGTKGRQHIDRMIFDTFDKVFVATNYHKKKIEDYFGKRFNNLIVVGFPFYREDVLSYAKPLPFEEKCGILINGRMEQSNSCLIERIKKKFKDENVSVLHAQNRKEYYEQLNQAKVVISLKFEETFGVGQLEGYLLGGIPLSPAKFSYPEVIGDERLLYEDEDGLVDKLAYLLTLKKNPFYIDIEQYEHVIARCIEEMI